MRWMKTANLALNAATTSAKNLLAKKGMTVPSMTVNTGFSASIESALCQETSETYATSIQTACLALNASTSSALSHCHLAR